MPIQFEIKHRFSGAVIFTAEIEASEDTPFSIKLGLAVRKAVTAGANLAGANLAGANLADANLAGAYLAGANLADANLAGAYLAGANLADANLAGANLAGAYLAAANLADANLADANLAEGFKWRDGVMVTKQPLQVHGLRWPVTILDAHMQIGCQFHELSRWDGFSDALIDRMDPHALEFWKANKAALMAIAKANGRG